MWNKNIIEASNEAKKEKKNSNKNKGLSIVCHRT